LEIKTRLSQPKKKQTSFQHLDEKKGNKITESFEILLTNNSKTKSFQVRIEEILFRSTKFEIASNPQHSVHEKETEKIFWTLKLAANSKAKIVYTVQYNL